MKMTGRKHQPFFRICVIDRQKARDGLPIEELGTYDPMVKTKSERVKVNMERSDYWISVGATPSDRVATLLKKNKNIASAHPRPHPEKVNPKALPAEEAAPAEEAPAEGGEAAS